MSLDEALRSAVAEAVEHVLARRPAEPEPLVYTIPEAARVLRTSEDTVRRLVGDGVLPLVPHMGGRRVIPRRAVVDLVDSARP